MATKKKSHKGGDALSTCPECGESIKIKNMERHISRVHDKSAEKNSTEDVKPGKTKTSTRERNKAEKEEAREKERQKKQDLMWFGGLGIVIIVIVIGYFMYTGPVTMFGDDSQPDYQRIKGTPTIATYGTNEIKIPVSILKDGLAHYYYFETNATRVNYFLVKGGNGEIHAAFDACEKCYDNKKGYRKDGNWMVCNSCTQRFAVDDLDHETSVCFPVPLNKTVSDNYVFINTTALDDGSWFFK